MIKEFAQKWLEKFQDPNVCYIELVEHYFADDCQALRFEMDCGHAFGERYGNAVNNADALREIINEISDIQLLGSAIYSQWRYFNHWASYPVPLYCMASEIPLFKASPEAV